MANLEWRERLATGGGLQFWKGYSQEKESGEVNGSYANWKSEEPNDYNGVEHVAHIYIDGTWNDFSPVNDTIEGYVVEYGGMPGDDTDTQISAIKNIVIVTVDKSRLQAEVNLSISLIAEKDKYLQASWDNYQNALDEAKQVLSDETADQTKVNDAQGKLEAARKA